MGEGVSASAYCFLPSAYCPPPRSLLNFVSDGFVGHGKSHDRLCRVQLFPGPAGSILRAGVLLCDSRFLQEKNRGPQKRGSALPSLERDGFDPLTLLRAEAEFADISQVSLRRA